MINPNCVVAVLVLAWATSWCAAGDLGPPAGPVAPTMKTLQQVEPRTMVSAATTPGDTGATFAITQPGSYYLMGNLQGESGKYGIRIESPNVTLDLNGFALLGVAGALSGVFVASDGILPSIIVRNGTVANWPVHGVDLFHASSGSIIQNIAAHNNLSIGIRSANSSVVTGCSSYDNGFGIVGVNNSVVENCVTFSNTFTGITVGTGGQVRGCTSRENSLGIGIGTGSSAVNCNVVSNTGNGIQALSAGCLIDGCTVSSNALDGIQVGSHSRIQRCEVYFNGGDGIQATGNCDIRGNAVGAHNASGSAGIRLTSGDTIVEGNQLTGNATGIIASAANAGNLIIRNTFAGNATATTLDASNRAAQFITPAANNFVSTDPNANLVY